MIYRRKTYKINPKKLNDFNYFFHTYLYPNQIKNGAKLIGRWVNQAQDEILAIWEYKSMEHYETVEDEIRKSALHKKAREKWMELGNLYTESKQDFMSSTAIPDTYHSPKHVVVASGYITNEKGEVLLVRNYHRSDTMEIPGGQVEEGENLEEAVQREVLEETGIEITLIGVTGLYQNVSNNIFCVVFRGEYKSGKPRTAEGETSEVFFTELTKGNIHEYITRPNFRNRVIDAMDANYLPFEAYKVRPYELVSRFEVKKEGI